MVALLNMWVTNLVKLDLTAQFLDMDKAGKEF
jgi:hypothetical protein